MFIEFRRLPYPQAWNLYAYTRNNPLKYVDPDGMEVKVTCTGSSDEKKQQQCIEQTTTDLNNRKGAQFKVEIKGGKLAVVGTVDASKLTKSEAALYKAITDTKNVSELMVKIPGIGSENIMFGQYNGVGSNTVDRADLNQLNKVNTSLSGEVIAHEIIEGYVGVAEGLTTYKTAHIRADEFFGNVAVSNLKLLPEGAETATGGSAIYNFQRVGVSVKVEKTFITPQPAASISNLGTEPGHLKVTTVEPPKTTTPQTKEKKP